MLVMSTKDLNKLLEIVDQEVFIPERAAYL
jgi:hypothetical protein